MATNESLTTTTVACGGTSGEMWLRAAQQSKLIGRGRQWAAHPRWFSAQTADLYCASPKRACRGQSSLAWWKNLLPSQEHQRPAASSAEAVMSLSWYHRRNAMRNLQPTNSGRE